MRSWRFMRWVTHGVTFVATAAGSIGFVLPAIYAWPSALMWPALLGAFLLTIGALLGIAENFLRQLAED